MGVHVSRDDDPEMYKDTFEEAQRIIRISDEVRISLEKIEKPKKIDEFSKPTAVAENSESSKITSSKLAVKLKLKTADLLSMVISCGYVEDINEKQVLTNKGVASGGEAKTGRFGAYFI